MVIADMATQDGESTVTSTKMVCVDDFKRYTEKTMGSAELGYFEEGSDDQVTLRDNVAAFRR